ncbi:MAG: hypothetical protein ACTSQA_04450 [Candidatus Heimdallarchaeaceae archaeon]
MISKKPFFPRDFIVSALLLSGIVALYVLGVAAVANNYDNTNIISEGFSENYDKLTETADDVEVSRRAVQSGEGLSFLGTFDVAFQSTFTVIRLLFSALNLYGNMTANIVSDFTFLDAGVIKIFLTVGLSIITILLVYAWISSISRGRL